MEYTAAERRRVGKVFALVRDLVGFGLSQGIRDDLCVVLLTLPDPEFRRLSTAAKAVAIDRIAETTKPPTRPTSMGDKADIILARLEDRPKILNGVILRMLERGYVSNNTAYLRGNLDVRFLTPWAKSGDVWVRFNAHGTFEIEHAVSDTVDIALDSIGEIVTVEGDVTLRAYDWVARNNLESVVASGTATTPQEAQQAADKALRTIGWMLL